MSKIGVIEQEGTALEQAQDGIKGPVKVKSIDPGARTPFTICTSEGQTNVVGGKPDRENFAI